MSTLDNEHDSRGNPEESATTTTQQQQQQRQRSDLSTENVNAKLANPLAGYTQRELIGMGGAYARDHGMEDLVEEFQKVGFWLFLVVFVTFSSFFLGGGRGRSDHDLS